MKDRVESQDHPIVKSYSEKNHYDDTDGCWVLSGGWCGINGQPHRRCRDLVINRKCPKGVQPRPGDRVGYSRSTWGRVRC